VGNLVCMMASACRVCVYRCQHGLNESSVSLKTLNSMCGHFKFYRCDGLWLWLWRKSIQVNFR